MDHYIGWLKERVEEMQRLLKISGTILIHCDWHASHYIKTDILDKLFSSQNFLAEIIWHRANAHNDAKKKLAVLTDSIFYYSKSNRYTFNPIYSGHNEVSSQFYSLNDNDGKGFYQLTDISSPNPRPNMMYNWMGFPCPPKGWRYQKDTMSNLHNEGKIYYPKNKSGEFDYSKRPRLIRYLNEQKGLLLGNIWTDINNVQSQAKEKIGYPTQKPEALLERIIKMASNEGDTIMDCFVGGGTTCAVADKLERKWIGIDQSVQAIKVTELRLNKQQDLFSKPFIVQLHKYDYDTLRYQNAFEFESWIIQQYGGTSNVKQRNDFGLDGKAPDGAPIQVKRSDSVGRNVIDNFRSAVERADKRLFESNVAEGKPAGYIIAFSFNRGAIEEVARLKNKDNVIIRLVTVEEIIPVSKKPTLSIEVIDAGRDAKDHRLIEFIATAESPAGIEFFAWDFEYNQQNGFKPTVIIDKEGRQTHRFKPGQHQVAVKVVDDDGLENIDVIKLKVNGEIERGT